MKAVAGAALLVLLPGALYAQVRITEIMYDVPGTDSGREWIEVQNDGDSAVDFSLWKLFEEGVNHGISLASGEGALPAHGYAVISDTPAKFLADWPSFSGLLYDSLFSLKNTGETLVLHDQDGGVSDTVTYDPSLGAAGDGQTLQLSDTNWVVAEATPGAAFSATGETNTAETASTAAPSVAGPVVLATPVEPEMTVSAGKDRTVIAGADTVFSGEALGSQGEPLEHIDFLWNFGDGSTAEGAKVLHHYENPGRYAVTLSAVSGVYAKLAMIRVTAEDARIGISSATPSYIELTNSEAHDLDLSLWQLSALGKTFTLPAHTFLSAKTSVRFPSSVTGLTGGSDATLLYPNGVVAFSGRTAPLVPIPQTSAHSVSMVSTPAPFPSAPIEQPESAEKHPTAFQQEAAVANAQVSQGISVWFLSLGALIAAAAAGAIFVRRRNREAIEIIEE